MKMIQHPFHPCQYLDEDIEWFDINNDTHWSTLNLEFAEGTPLPLYETDSRVEYTILCGFAITMQDYNTWYDQRYPDSEDDNLIVNTYHHESGTPTSHTAYDQVCGDELHRGHEVTTCIESCHDLEPNNDCKCQAIKMVNVCAQFDETDDTTEQGHHNSVSPGQYMHANYSQHQELIEDHRCNKRSPNSQDDGDIFDENHKYNDDDQQSIIHDHPTSVTEQSEDMGEDGNTRIQSEVHVDDNDDIMTGEGRKHRDDGERYSIDLTVLFEGTELPCDAVEDVHINHMISEHNIIALRPAQDHKMGSVTPTSAKYLATCITKQGFPDHGSGNLCEDDRDTVSGMTSYCDENVLISNTHISGIHYNKCSANNHSLCSDIPEVPASSRGHYGTSDLTGMNHKFNETDHPYTTHKVTPRSSSSDLSNRSGHCMPPSCISASGGHTAVRQPRMAASMLSTTNSSCEGHRSTSSHGDGCIVCTRAVDSLALHMLATKDTQRRLGKEKLSDQVLVPSDKVENLCHYSEMVRPTDRPPPRLCHNSGQLNHSCSCSGNRET